MKTKCHKKDAVCQHDTPCLFCVQTADFKDVTIIKTQKIRALTEGIYEVFGRVLGNKKRL